MHSLKDLFCLGEKLRKRITVITNFTGLIVNMKFYSARKDIYLHVSLAVAQGLTQFNHLSLTKVPK